MKFGLGLPNRGVLFGQTTVAELLDLTQMADESGLFDSVWIGDSLWAKPRLESVAILGAMSARSQTVKLGVGCMASFPLRDPVVFAYQWATLDHLSGGRMVLAACTGLVGPAYAEEAAAFGATDGERVKRMIENIEILRKLWGEDNVTYHGQFRSFDNISLEPKPIQQPCPIWIAANPHLRADVHGSAADVALKRVVRRADGWMSVDMPTGIIPRRWQKVRQFAEELGKDPAAYAPYLYHNININENRDVALAETLKFIEHYYGPSFPRDFAEAWTVWGSPDDCIAGLRRLKSYGCSGVTLRLTTWNMRAMFDRLTREVLPYV